MPTTSPSPASRSPEATDLINRARSAAIAAFQGVSVSGDGVLSAFARRVRTEIFAQVLAGEWQAIGIRRVEQLAALRVSADVENSLVRGRKIRLRYDFSSTAIPHLLVDQV